ncbi:hypothetical protein CK203_061271 [Vitis vinifera]|uniref:Uncharacterized protein n=1 Tax=Vitis vinifera TaxID=29760 RepID=A0A438G5E0_VITVI|nr:hypothetical protein CK203_061271 [Vitis vinifera]
MPSGALAHSNRISVVIPANKASGQGVRMHPPMETVPLINGGEIFYVVMMTLGGSMAIITLRVADRDRGRKIRMRVTRMTIVSCVTVFDSAWLRNVFKEENCFIYSGGVVPTEKAEKDTIIFSKEQFNAGLRFPLPALFKEFLHFTQIPPAFIHPNIVRHVRSPALPSIGDGAARLDEGRGEGTRVVRGAWAGSKHPARPFSPNYSLVIPGPEKGATYPRICRQHSPQEAQRGSAWGALYCEGSPDLPGVKEADAEKRRALLDNREKEKEGTLRKAPGQKRGAASPPKKAPAKKRKLVKNGKGVKEPTPPKEFAPPPITHEAERLPVWLIWLRKLRPSTIRSPNPDVDAAEAVCATPMEEAGAESQSQPSDDPDRLALVLVKGPPSKRPSARNLRSGLIGRLQDRQQEIEVSCSSATTLIRRGRSRDGN